MNLRWADVDGSDTAGDEGVAALAPPELAIGATVDHDVGDGDAVRVVGCDRFRWGALSRGK